MPLMEILQDTSHRVCEKGDEPCLLIALAILVTVKICHGDAPHPLGTQVVIVPSWTDNRGNGACVSSG